jgi:RNA polymerase sigma-70 factor, ECF subfamily
MNSAAQPVAPDPAELAMLAELPAVTPVATGAPSLSDRDLVSRTRAGDTAAFAEIVGRHERSLLQLAQRFVRNDQDAQEVLQEVFVTTWTKLSSFEDRSQLSTWLYRVTVNAALMYLRGRRRHLQFIEAGGGVPVVAATGNEPASQRGARERPDEQLESRELEHALEQALDQLPASLRTVFELREVQGRSTRQTAHLLGISEGAVKSRLHRARHELQSEIKHCWLH